MSDHSIITPLMHLSPDRLSRALFSSSAGRRAAGEFRQGMLRFAGWLAAQEKIGRGESIAISLPKSLEAVQAI